jgi:hypothetical protein
MVDEIAPIDPNTSKIRDLISSLELCHHKAERWVNNIIEAIGAGETNKGLGTRSPSRQHPAEKVWQNTCDALSEWVSGYPSTSMDVTIDHIPASRIPVSLGERSPLKEWQVQRVIEKIRSLIQWPNTRDDQKTKYVWLLLNGDEYGSTYLNQCPEIYKEHKDFWLRTVRTIIHDTENGDEAELSLALAIDMLWPCNWRFVKNLQIVLEAIGGKLKFDQPFAACGRNIKLSPVHHQMGIISNTLKVFCGAPKTDEEIDRDLLSRLGKSTDVKKWLAASLDKTIRLQLNPPAELRARSTLAGPDWIRQ